MSASQAQSVRKAFQHWVRRYVGGELSSTVLETTLIRDGSYCGRRFSSQGFSIIWFIDEQQVKFYGQDGSLLRSMSATEFCETVPTAERYQEIRRVA
jgi:hypothetical protein